MSDYPELMSAAEAAKLFGVNKKTILRWIDSIKGFPIPVTPEGANVKFIKQEMLDYFYRGRDNK
ncbi:helix-turn-helix domain-containing protein [Escherichia coli]|uniref:DNA-binding protein n=1 Tax=Escherichia coli TaxID=562 RepID=A0A377EL91_ECOLX|nr:helix-turn-helix domain-containing protein [Escherichia coli]EHS0494765.1 helix-turn-helix domain-containing protein [Escherichia coli O26]HDR9899473.1 helix-turn-helix domain-containing protein [Escherichia coli C240-52 (9c)]EFA7392805.1 helix-turn-helix domain-containing protein [Escherichia coli]EFB4498140.1 helix-turn-helix domain-containing protein [Escherichia coli]EFB9216649.1 helix-turn-helix domain-containing protein [Escherichia coli]